MRPILLTCLMALSGAASAAEIDLLVTDYNENPAQDQKALIDQPLVYNRPQEVAIKTADGNTIVHKSPARVAVNRESAEQTRFRSNANH